MAERREAKNRVEPLVGVECEREISRIQQAGFSRLGAEFIHAQNQLGRVTVDGVLKEIRRGPG